MRRYRVGRDMSLERGPASTTGGNVKRTRRAPLGDGPLPVAAGGLRPWAGGWCCWYVGAAAVLSVLYFGFPGQHLWLWTPLGVSSVAAVVLGVRHHRPRRPGAWYAFAGALFCFVAGDTIYNVLTEVLHRDNPFPSLADVFYLAMYPLIAGGLLLLIRARTTRRDPAALLDALTVATGMCLLSWVYLILPYVEARDLTWGQRATSVAYPLGDVLVLVMLARLVGGGLRLRALQLLVAGGAGLLVADVAYGWIQLNGSWRVGGPVDLGWVVFYVSWGTAALHPSMRAVSEPTPLAHRQVHRRQIALLTLVSLIAPAVLLAAALTHQRTHAATVAVFCAVLFLLVIARLAGIVAVHREAVLPGAGAAHLRRGPGLRPVPAGRVRRHEHGGPVAD